MVDYIRSAYSCPVRFFRDDPLSVLNVRWSFVPENTPGMPFSHAFGSRQWDLDEEEEPLVGELDGPRAWRGGLPAFPLPIVGPLGIDNLGLCGSEDQWKRGALTSDPVPPVWLFTGVKQCCKRPPKWADGGVAIGRATGVTCGTCSDLPKVLFLTVVNQPGFTALFSGTWPLVWDEAFGLYSNTFTLSNGKIVVVNWLCNLLLVVSNDVLGGGTATVTRCYPYKSEFVADGIFPIFGTDNPSGWRADCSMSE